MTSKSKIPSIQDSDFFMNLSDDELRGMQFSMPWQVQTAGGEERDADGFDSRSSDIC